MSIEEFKQRRENERASENFKTGVVATLILSLIIFSGIGEENMKPIIWYWAAFMSALVIVAAVLDVIAWRKNRKIGASHE